jgi:two-component system, cell cycle response regulator
MADDSATSRVVLEQALLELGHRPVVAEDGVQAWELFLETRPAVVISDWVMPGMDGAELCRRIRKDESVPYAYFIMLTSLEERQHVLDGMKAGADDYLTKPLDTNELEMRLIAASRVTELHEKLAAQQAAVKELNEELHKEARRDPLTRVGNRLLLREELEGLAGRITRYGHRSALLLFDVDHFKAYNDTAGHLAGDDVLASVAAELERQARQGDRVFRYGGEEFLVLLAEQDLSQAALVAERMRAAIEKLAIPHPSPAAGSVVTVSVGVATMESGTKSDPDGAMKRADQALYRAKEAGRNQVRLEPDDPD